jgi:hypothetical protein
MRCRGGGPGSRRGDVQARDGERFEVGFVPAINQYRPARHARGRAKHVVVVGQLVVSVGGPDQIRRRRGRPERYAVLLLRGEQRD